MHTEFNFQQGDEVITKDDQTMGGVITLYQRPTDVNILEKLFPYYLKTFDETRGDDFYIPTHYVDKRLDGKIHLKLTLKQALSETLTREPQFIAHGDATEHKLPQEASGN